MKETHGNMYQCGFPDIYAAHARYGARWIEVKNPEGFKFTAAQLEFFPKLQSAGIQVWVLMAATDEEYAKLFKDGNWWMYRGLL